MILAFIEYFFHRYISDIHRNINVNSNAKSELYKPKLEDEETINSWGLDTQSAVKPQAESTIDTYLDNPQSRFLIISLIYFDCLVTSHVFDFIVLYSFSIEMIYFCVFMSGLNKLLSVRRFLVLFFLSLSLFLFVWIQFEPISSHTNRREFNWPNTNWRQFSW